MSRCFRYSILSLAIVALSAPRGYSQPASAPATSPELDAAVAKLRENKVDEAVKLLEEARVRHPEFAPPWVILYNIFRESDPNKARQCLETAVTASPADPEAFVIMGNIALQEHRLAEAELLFLKSQSLLATFTGSAQRKKVLDPLTISGLASVSEVRQAWPKAEQQLNELLRLEPKSAGVMQRLAKAMFFQKNAGDAYKKLIEAKNADPANVLTPEASLAILYEQFNDRKDATIWFDKALAKAPKDLPTHRIVTRWALDTGQIAKAKEQADICLSLDSKSLENMLLRGVVALYEDDYAKAEEYFQLAHLESPINFAATNNLALALCEEVDATGKPDPSKLQRALEYAKQNYDANQRNPDTCSTLGWVLFKKKEYDQAALALRSAIQAANGGLSFDTAYYLAMVQDARGQKEEAKKIVEQILRSDKPFSKRKAAKDLLAKLEKEVPATTPTSTGVNPKAIP